MIAGSEVSLLKKEDFSVKISERTKPKERRGSFLSIWEPACGEVGTGGRWRGVRITREWGEHIRVTIMTWENGGFPRDVMCYPETPRHDQEQTQRLSPPQPWGYQADPRGPAGTTLRLCSQGATREEGLASGLLWTQGGLLGVLGAGLGCLQHPQGSGARTW